MPSDKDSMQGFLDRSVADVKADLDGLGEQDLVQAINLEREGKNRSSLISALEKRLADVRAENGDDEDEGDTEGGKASRGEEIPAWQKPDYDGPMTLEIARWRNRNLTQKAEGSEKETK